MTTQGSLRPNAGRAGTLQVSAIPQRRAAGHLAIDPVRLGSTPAAVRPNAQTTIKGE